MFPILAVIFSTIVVLLFFWIIWRKHAMSFFQQHGIPGPKPKFITGNMKDFNEKRGKYLEEWTNKYGKFFGFFLGAKPYLMCTDVEFLKIMQIKEFRKFSCRHKLFPDSAIPHELTKNLIGFRKYNDWKALRSIITSAFTSQKIRKMSLQMSDPINHFLKNVEMQHEESFGIVELCKKITLDIMCRVLIGLKIDAQTKESSEMIQSMQRLQDTSTFNTLLNISFLFPEFEPIPTYLRLILDILRNWMNVPSVRFAFQQCQRIIDFRKKSQVRLADFLQHMLDSEKKYQNLTNDFIITQMISFIDVGYETLSNTLEWSIYFVTKYPKVQEKIRQEISDNLNSKNDIHYEDLRNFKYLEQVLLETLRLSPLSDFVVNRMCSENFEYKGMTIPKGTVIAVPLSFLHRTANYWSEPEKFDPDRFSLENRGKINPMVYQPFGVGPRNCIGREISLTIMKFILSNLCRNFRLSFPKHQELEAEETPFQTRLKDTISIKAAPIKSF